VRARPAGPRPRGARRDVAGAGCTRILREPIGRHGRGVSELASWGSSWAGPCAAGSVQGGPCWTPRLQGGASWTPGAQSGGGVDPRSSCRFLELLQGTWRCGEERAAIETLRRNSSRRKVAGDRLCM